MPKWEIQWVQDILWHLEKIEGWKCKSFIDSSQKYLNNEYIVIEKSKEGLWWVFKCFHSKKWIV